MAKENNLKNNKFQPAISLVLVVLILGSILTASLIFGELLIRQGQIMRASGFSELAYYAAESGIESLAFKINKLQINAFGEGFSYANNLPNNSFYNLERATLITNSVPWQISLTNQSFQLDFDLNIDYPSSITINTSQSGEVILYCWQREGSGKVDFINFINNEEISYEINDDCYYRLKIRHPNNSSADFVLNAPEPIPTGFKLEFSGFFKNFHRKIETFFPKFFFY